MSGKEGHPLLKHQKLERCYILHLNSYLVKILRLILELIYGLLVCLPIEW